MLELKVTTEEREVVLRFEHSLLSLSKWESIHRKPWMVEGKKTPPELISYFQCMLLPPEEDTALVYALAPEQMEQLVNYMNANQTASSVPKEGRKELSNEIMTSELIYYWMVAMKIPFAPAESWHLSRLMMLIQITSYKAQPPKKKSPTETMTEWRAENERRKKMFGTSG